MTEPLIVKNSNPGLDLLKQYQISPAMTKLHALLLSGKGAGKTTLLETAPKPVLIFSFDPGGTSVLQEEIEKGDVIVVNCEEDSFRNPKAYMEFQNQYNKLGAAGTFKEVGTTVLDTVTTYNDSAIWQIQKKEGKIIAGMDQASSKDTMSFRDWGTLLSLHLMWARQFCSLPCHTFWMGHIQRDYDELQKTHLIKLMLTGQAKDKVATLIPDVWFLQIDNKGERYLLTDYEDGFPASTKIGKRKFDRREKPDIKYLLKKAGLDYEDKPGFGTNRKEGTTGWDSETCSQ